MDDSRRTLTPLELLRELYFASNEDDKVLYDRNRDPDPDWPALMGLVERGWVEQLGEQSLPCSFRVTARGGVELVAPKNVAGFKITDAGRAVLNAEAAGVEKISVDYRARLEKLNAEVEAELVAAGTDAALVRSAVAVECIRCAAGHAEHMPRRKFAELCGSIFDIVKIRGIGAALEVVLR